MRKKCCGVINGGVAVRAGWPLSGRERERERYRKRERERGRESHIACRLTGNNTGD